MDEERGEEKRAMFWIWIFKFPKIPIFLYNIILGISAASLQYDLELL